MGLKNTQKRGGRESTDPPSVIDASYYAAQKASTEHDGEDPLAQEQPVEPAEAATLETAQHSSNQYRLANNESQIQEEETKVHTEKARLYTAGINDIEIKVNSNEESQTPPWPLGSRNAHV